MLGKLSDSFRQIEGKLSPQIGLQDEDDVPLTVERPVVLQLHLGPTLNSRRLGGLTRRLGSGHLEVLGQLLQGCLHEDAQLLHHLLAVHLSQFFGRSLNFG